MSAESERKNHQHKGKFTEDLLNKESILESLNIETGQTILDAGCGNGYMSKAFSEKVGPSGKVYALDPDSHFIKILQDETRGGNITAMEGDISSRTRIESSSLDILYISAVIHGFSKSQMDGFLREAKRLLKADAKLAIVEIEKKETPFGPPLKIRYSPEELKETVPLLPLSTVKAGEYFYMQIFKNK